MASASSLQRVPAILYYTEWFVCVCVCTAGGGDIITAFVLPPRLGFRSRAYTVYRVYGYVYVYFASAYTLYVGDFRLREKTIVFRKTRCARNESRREIKPDVKNADDDDGTYIITRRYNIHNRVYIYIVLLFVVVYASGTTSRCTITYAYDISIRTDVGKIVFI